jgi:hypothetical protein
LPGATRLEESAVKDPTGPLDVIVPKILVDRSLEASRNAVLLSVASMGAFINQTAALHLRIWDDNEARLSLRDR